MCPPQESVLTRYLMDGLGRIIIGSSRRFYGAILFRHQPVPPIPCCQERRYTFGLLKGLTWQHPHQHISNTRLPVDFRQHESHYFACRIRRMLIMVPHPPPFRDEVFRRLPAGQYGRPWRPGACRPERAPNQTDGFEAAQVILARCLAAGSRLIAAIWSSCRYISGWNRLCG